MLPATEATFAVIPVEPGKSRSMIKKVKIRESPRRVIPLERLLIRLMSCSMECSELLVA